MIYNILGNIKHPFLGHSNEYKEITETHDSPQGYVTTVTRAGIISFLNNLLALIIVIAGIFTLINFILAGYKYLSSSGDPKKIGEAGNQMLNTIIGLAIVAGGFIIAAIIGKVLFNNPLFLLEPTLYQ